LNIAIVIFSCHCDHSFFQADFKTVVLFSQQLVEIAIRFLGELPVFFVDGKRVTFDVITHRSISRLLCAASLTFIVLVTPSCCGKRLSQLIAGVVVLLFKNHALSANGSNCMDACVV